MGDDDRYGSLFRSLLLPAWERVQGRSKLARVAELRRTQWLSFDELRAMQDRSLRRLLRHAYEHVPLYRERFAGAGARPEDVGGLDGLARLPVLTRREARERARDRVSGVPPRVTIRKVTSGTSGEPLAFGYDSASEEWRQAVKLRGYEWAGFRPGDRAFFFWGVPTPPEQSTAKRAKVGLDRWLRRERYVPCSVVSDDTMREVVRRLFASPPRVLVCYTQAGAELARFVRREGLRVPRIPYVLCGAERLYPHDRSDLAQVFGARVFDTYGCREVMLIGAECHVHDGLHLSMENLVVELLVTGADGVVRPAEPGETGEVVVTDLHNFAMPFIRYATGDVAVAGPSSRCTCGRALSRIASVEGRTSETLRDGRGNRVSSVALSHIFTGLEAAVRRFQLVQHVDRSVTLHVVPSRKFDRGTEDVLRTRCARQLAGIDVHVRPVAALPRSAAGKHRLVVAESGAE
jgi:phenylacetate-CoA ligase